MFYVETLLMNDRPNTS